jgi:hypothetical protein
MKISILVSDFGPQKVRCLMCAQRMRLVGIEAHPKIPGTVDLVTFECGCGEVLAEPRFAQLEMGAQAS